MAKDLQICYLLDFYGDMLTQKQRQVIEQYYNDDLSLAEIAENFGISRQGVRDAIKHGETTLLELEQKVGFARRHAALQQNLDELKKLAGDVRYYNSVGYHTDSRIEKAAGQMLQIIRQMEQEDA